MKGRKRVSIIIFVLILIVWVSLGSRDKRDHELVQKKKYGTAIVITGAAARIAQEAALLEELYNRGLLKNVVFISGASSGALNAAVLNAILDGKYTWKEYREVLTKLKNDDIFIKHGTKLPVDTKPLRNLINTVIVDRLGYKTLADLPYPTAFSIVNLKALPMKERTFRLCNRKINPESDSSLSIVDVLMASTSIPIAFPPTPISNLTTLPNQPYFDGGIADDHVPYQALIQFENYCGFDVERMIVISRKRDSIPNLNEELQQFGIDKFKFFDKLGVSAEAISNKGFMKRLNELKKESPYLAERTFVYVPEFKEDFLMLDFNNMKQQYEITSRWAKTHNPIPLDQYLNRRKK